MKRDRRSIMVLLLLAAWLCFGVSCKPEDSAEVEEDVLFESKEVVLGVNDANDTFHQLTPVVAAMKNGGFAVTWERNDGRKRDIVLQVVSAQGEPLLGNGGRVISPELDDATESVVMAHPTNGVFVAYAVLRQGIDQRVWVQYFNNAGEAVWPEPVIASAGHETYGQREPALVADPKGGVYVGFSSYVNFETDTIFCQHLDANGNRLWGDSGYDAGGTNGMRAYPRMVADNNGGVMVFWGNQHDIFSTNPQPPNFIEGQRFSAEGNRLWGLQGKHIQTLNIPCIGWYTYRDYYAVKDGKGGAVLAFNDLVGLAQIPWIVKAQRISPEGELLWGDGAVVASGEDGNYTDALVADDNGGAFVAVWTYVLQSDTPLFVYRLSADGKHLWGGGNGVQMSNPNGFRGDYSACGHYNGKTLRLIWTHQLEFFTPYFDIAMGRVSADGKLLDEPGGFPICNAVGRQFHRDLAYNPVSKRIFTVWEDGRHTEEWNFNVYGAIIRDGKRVKSTTPQSYSRPTQTTSITRDMGDENDSLQQPLELPAEYPGIVVRILPDGRREYVHPRGK